MATGRERKTNTHIPFGQTLAMDRFLSTAEPEKREKSMALTREMTNLRTRLHELRDKKVCGSRCSG
jgi:ubiquitin carboxyl-terminal hydrolase 25/28